MADQLDEIKARLAAADWPLMEARRDRNTHNRDKLWAAVSVDDFEGRFPQWLGDRERAEWFVNAPADMAYLIAEAERLRDLARRNADRAEQAEQEAANLYKQRIDAKLRIEQLMAEAGVMRKALEEIVASTAGDDEPGDRSPRRAGWECVQVARAALASDTGEKAAEVLAAARRYWVAVEARDNYYEPDPARNREHDVIRDVQDAHDGLLAAVAAMAKGEAGWTGAANGNSLAMLPRQRRN